ncbi:MAG TPA: hypothetical protein DHW01_05055 [Rhodobacter sp.]|nr:hypothetical protein [Rhodobacter sp.]
MGFLSGEGDGLDFTHLGKIKIRLQESSLTDWLGMLTSLYAASGGGTGPKASVQRRRQVDS